MILSRTHNMIRNIKYSYIGNSLIMLLGFVVRTIFLKSLGKTYLGLNSFYTSVIGVLSIAELGIGGVLNTQLYKPVADNDFDSIVSILQLYKKVYYIIAIVILIIGLLILPFIGFFIQGVSDIRYIKIYYLFFLFNTVVSYFVSYKFSITNAEQKNYINTNFDMIGNAIMYVFQIIVLLVFKNYLFFLLINSFVIIAKLIIINLYMDKRYTYFTIHRRFKIDNDKKLVIKKNIVGGIANRLADVVINQSDSIIISKFVNIDSLGIASNYITLRGCVEKFARPLLDDNSSTIGNYVNTESDNRKLLLIKTLQLYALMIYGFVSLQLYFLSSPFVRIWLGNDMVLTNDIIFLICFSLLISGVGDRPYVLLKGSHGIYYDDWYVSIITVFVNIVVSIILVIPYGLVGVYIGTVCTNVISVIWRPFIFYKILIRDSLFNYYIRLLKNIIIVFVCAFICSYIFSHLYISNVLFELFIKGMIVTAVFIIMFLFVFIRTEEYRYIYKLVKNYYFNRH